jgi:hypothetical protein
MSYCRIIKRVKLQPASCSVVKQRMLCYCGASAIRNVETCAEFVQTEAVGSHRLFRSRKFPHSVNKQNLVVPIEFLLQVSGTVSFKCIISASVSRYLRSFIATSMKGRICSSYEESKHIFEEWCLLGCYAVWLL